MILLDHILKQKLDNKECKIKQIVTDLADEYAPKYKYLGVNITRGLSGQLKHVPDTDLPDDTIEDSSVSRLRRFWRYFISINIEVY